MAANGCSRSFSGSKKSTSSGFGLPSASATPRSAATKPEEEPMDPKNSTETVRKYADLLHAERPNSEESRRKHPRMSLQNRAKIFSPFAALRGYDEEIQSVCRRSQQEPQRTPEEEALETYLNDLP